MNKDIYKSNMYQIKSRFLKGKMFLQMNNNKCFRGSIEVIDGVCILNNEKGEYQTAIFEPRVFMECMPKDAKDIILNSYLRN